MFEIFRGFTKFFSFLLGFLYDFLCRRQCSVYLVGNAEHILNKSFLNLECNL
jgi:hypothetical protein